MNFKVGDTVCVLSNNKYGKIIKLYDTWAAVRYFEYEYADGDYHMPSYDNLRLVTPLEKAMF
jgi:hypothetical protein